MKFLNRFTDFTVDYVRIISPKAYVRSTIDESQYLFSPGERITETTLKFGQLIDLIASGEHIKSTICA